MITRQVSHGTEINSGGLCIQRVARRGQVWKLLRYSFKMEIPVTQPFGSGELTENPYHIEVLYPQTCRWVFRQCFHVAVADGLDPCNGLIIRHFLGVLCHGHQLVIETRQLSDLSWYTVYCLMIRRRLSQLRLWYIHRFEQ